MADVSKKPGIQNLESLKQILRRLPQVNLGLYPTPLTEAKHLSEALAGPRIFFKREDLNGMLLGGNKCRHLEFIMALAKQQGADSIVSTSGSQSNFCTLMAAASHKLGMYCNFVLMKDIHPEIQGNLLLQNIMDSEIEIWDVPHEAVFGDAMSNKLDHVADCLRAKGYNPFIIRHAYPDISTILSSVGWVNASVEIFQQIESLKIKPRRILLAAATGGTMSGLILGSKYLGAAYKPLGISVWMGKRDVEARILQRANGVSEYLKLGTKVTPEDIEIMDDYIGERYGIPTKEGIAALKLVAKTEGIILDPVYTSKAMSGVIDLIRKGEFTYKDTIIFIHTGGIPPLFAYYKEVIQ